MSSGGARWNTGATKVCKVCGENYKPGDYQRHAAQVSHLRMLKNPPQWFGARP